MHTVANNARLLFSALCCMRQNAVGFTNRRWLRDVMGRNAGKVARILGKFLRSRGLGGNLRQFYL
jgi:hypothetical protein